MFRTILRTNDSFAPLVMRLGMGPFFLAAVWAGMLALGLGDGPSTTSERLARAYGVSEWLAIPFGVALCLGGLFLVLGWCTRIVAAVTAAVILVFLARTPPLTALSHSGEYFEVLAFILAAALTIALAITGGGRLSLDRLIGTKQRGALANGTGSVSHVLLRGAPVRAADSAAP